MSVTIGPEAPGAGSPSDHATSPGSHDPRSPADPPPGDPSSERGPSVPGRRSDAESAARLATRRLCPYLTIDGGGWRSAVAEREHRCGAVTPMALLTLDKQRRLCLTDRHLTCATFLAARGLDATTSESPERPIVAVGPGRLASAVAGQEAVTRWSIVRTTPVILDHSRIPVVAQLPRGRAAGQLGLAVLLVAAFAALAVGRLGGPSTPGLVGAGSSSSSRPTSSAAIVGAASPTAPPEPTGTPAPTPKKTPKPTKSPPPSATPRPSPSNTAVATTYKVKSGDTLYGISIRFHTSVKSIQELNNLTGTTLHIGQVLKIP